MKELITSSKNAQLKRISALLKSKKERDESGLFVIEGVRIVRDALQYAGACIRSIYLSDSFEAGQLGIGAAELEASGIGLETVKESVFNDISGTVSSQGVLAVVEKPRYSIEEILTRMKKPGAGTTGRTGAVHGAGADESTTDRTGAVHGAGADESTTGRAGAVPGANAEGVETSVSQRLLLLEDIQDPGNLGTLIRTAEAAGIEAVIMSSSTADVFNPKVIRSTMGSCFRVPFVYADSFTEAVEEVRRSGVRVYAAYLHGGKNYREISFEKRCAIMIGNEGNGLSEEAVAVADERVFIPMCGQIESLNAAVAGAVLMYAL